MISERDTRLCSVAELVRQDAVLADIGTDHAYLPLFLFERGRIQRAIATDVAEGPLATARANVAETPYADRVSFLLTDGLDGLEGRGITDVTVCGMGGELIAAIVARAPMLRDAAIRLILQPMTRQEQLRRELSRRGFSVTEERYSAEGNRAYVTLCVQYSGVCTDLSPEEAVLGTERAVTCEAHRAYLERKRTSLLRAVRGREMGALCADEERAMLAAVERVLND